MFKKFSNNSGFELDVRDQMNCTVCSIKAAIMISVFHFRNNQVVADLIRNVIPKLSIEKRSKNSKQICSNCLDIIVNANVLRVLSIQSEEKLLWKETSLDNDNPRCRICLSESNNLHKIFNFRRGRTTIDAISGICPVTIKTSDSFSHDICSECLHTIDAAWELRDGFEDQKFPLREDQRIEVKNNPAAVSSSSINFVDVDEPVVLAIEVDDDCVVTSVPTTRNASMPLPIIPRKVVLKNTKRALAKPMPIKRDCCEICRVQFTSKVALDIHNKLKHKENDKTFICRFKNCNQRFKDGPAFRAHVTNIHIKKTTGLNINLVKKSTVSNAPEAASKAKGILKKMGFLEPKVQLNASFSASSRNKLVKCEFCHRHYESLALKNDHIRYAHRELYNSGLYCKQCSLNFSSAAEFNEHVEKNHSVHFSCSICYETFRTNKEMEGHIISEHKTPLTYECAYCSVTTSSKIHLENHLKKHVQQPQTERTFKCLLCNIVIKGKVLAYQHMMTHKTKQNSKVEICDVCGYKTLNHDSFLNHKAKHTSVSGFICTSCGLSIPSEKELELHEFSHSDIVEKLSNEDALVSCSACGYKSISDAAMMKHLEEHQERLKKNAIACLRCKTIISDFDNLLDHQKSHMTRKNYKCLSCQRTFTYGDTFLKHIRQHVTNRCASCSFNQTFNTKEELEEHMKLKHVRLSHLCSICGASCQSGAKMKIHMEKHSGEPKFNCPKEGCEKKFWTKRNLNKHLTVHEKRIFQCTFCETTFSNRSSQSRHELCFHVDDGKALSCTQCDATFKRKDHLRKHERDKH